MADDGMLVNFTIGAASLKPKTTLKGGTWRDRLKVKKNLNGIRRTTQKAALSGSNTIPTKPRPTPAESTGGEDVERLNKRRKINEGSTHASKSSGEVVSSLFTSNPKGSSLQEPANAQEEANSGISPSNAPLPAVDNPFSGLGLSQNLSAHLSQALSLNAPTAIQKCAIPQLLQADSDAFVQAETGSGKTLAYLLPILQRLMLATVANSDAKQDGSNSLMTGLQNGITRSSGLLALILVPTRELTHQIEVVLTRLLSRTPRIVAGSVTGGATKNHEKARIRKGLNILVATPGRLVDHLQHTKSLDLRRVAWLVLDEGDRLMELGFEHDIKQIMEALDGNDLSAGKKGSKKAEDDWKVIHGLPTKRIAVLCSATLNSSVQKLGEMSLKDAIRIYAAGQDSIPTPDSMAAESKDSISPPDVAHKADTKALSTPKTEDSANAPQITVPAQLKQSYLIVPLKQRLVSLVALLRHTFARRGSVMRAIVFLSCADSVDFHFSIFGYGASTKQQDDVKSSAINGTDANTHLQTIQSSKNNKAKPRSTTSDDTLSLPTTSTSPTLSPHIRIFRLHGSLAPASRNSTIKAFAACQQPCLLLATDVASRGLDLPNIDLVIEYDPAFSAEEHVHRVGRTARAGREGRAVCFLSPGPEEGYVKLLESFAGRNHASAGSSATTEQSASKSPVKGETSDAILRKGFTLPASTSTSSPSPLDLPIPAGPASSHPDDQPPALSSSTASKYDSRATDYQLGLERWILSAPRIHDLARKAYVSHVRAYATHTVAERAMFDVKALQLGHLAKAFGLRDRPGGWGRKSGGGGVGGAGKGGQQRQQHQQQRRDDRVEKRSEGSTAEAGGAVDGAATTVAEQAEAARKMRESVRKMAKMNQGHDVGEFNIG